MTTQVQERIPTTVLPAQSRRSARGSWIVFLAATVLAALAIGVIAALLGNAIKGVDTATGLLGSARSASVQADAAYTDALAAEEAAKADLEAQRQAVVDELAQQQNGSSFSEMGVQAPEFAALDRLEASIEQHETAARIEADAARAEAAQAVETAQTGLARAESDAAGAQGPLWIAIIASGVLLLVLAAVAILRTRAVRRYNR